MLNEAENVASLVAEIQKASQSSPIKEIILVDDGSTDGTADIIKTLKITDSRIRLIRHSTKAGQSASLRTGIRAANSNLVVTLDGDGQNDPADIPAIYETWAKAAGRPAMCMVAGQRKKRMDSLLKKFTSRMGNGIRGFLLQDGIRDTGCSLKLFRRDDYLALPYFNHMHRFLPALFLREHGHILTVDVGHRHRERGISKYGFWDRLWAGLSDIFGVLWLKARASHKIIVTEE